MEKVENAPSTTAKAHGCPTQRRGYWLVMRYEACVVFEEFAICKESKDWQVCFLPLSPRVRCSMLSPPVVVAKGGWTRLLSSEEPRSTWQPSCARCWTKPALKNYSIWRPPSWARALRADLYSVFCPPHAFPLLSTAIHHFAHSPCFFFMSLASHPSQRILVDRIESSDRGQKTNGDSAPETKVRAFVCVRGGCVYGLIGDRAIAKHTRFFLVEGFLFSCFNFHSPCVLTPEPRGSHI